MEQRRLHAFADDPDFGSYCLKMAIARDLQRMMSDVPRRPLPTDLQQLIRKLEEVTSARGSIPSPDPSHGV